MFSVLFLLAIPAVDGFCYSSSGRIDKTVTGRMIPVCEFQGLDVLDGSKFRTANCMDCKCNSGTLNCCGFGINAGVYMPPVGCKMIADGCDPIFVLEADETRECKTGEKINLITTPSEITPSFPGTFPFPGLKIKDPRDMLGNAMNYHYSYQNKIINPFYEEATRNSLRNFLLSNGWIM